MSNQKDGEYLEEERPAFCWKCLFILFLSLGFLYGPVWQGYIESLYDPYIFSSDLRSFGVPLLRIIDAELFPNDYIVDYIEKTTPIGFYLIYKFAGLFSDPYSNFNTVGIILFFIGLVAIGMASYRLSGWSGAWVTIALLLSRGPDLSGLTRTFIFPVIALSLAAMLFRRLKAVAFICLLGVSVYPPSGFIVSIILFLWLMVWPQNLRGEAEGWSFKRRAVFLAVTALLFVAVEAKHLMENSAHGPLLTTEYCDEYEEMGPNGRMGENSPCIPIQPLSLTIKNISLETLTDLRWGEEWNYALRTSGKWWLKDRGINRDYVVVVLLLGFVFVGYLLALAKNPGGQILLIIFAAGCLGYIVSIPLVPRLYLPVRYLSATLPPFLLVALPAVTYSMVGFLGSRFNISLFTKRYSRQFFVLFVGVCALLVLGGKGKVKIGIDKDLMEYEPIIEYVQTLPKDVMIAAWPKSIVESLPFLARRSIFISNEYAFPVLKKISDITGERTYKFIDAYFSTDLDAIKSLRDSYGVTHIVIDKRHFEDGKLRYFAPFLEYAKKKRLAGKEAGYELIRLIPKLKIFAFNDLIILDLKCLEPNAKSALNLD
ncbi:MAG: hypothetical protein HQL70_01355 [Magnetococcales bacterium]|nr:hypothetical protein [Magnetococcales bacterium]